MKNKKTIIWFKNDLRISDNPALSEALKNGRILPIYILEENEQKLILGDAQKWWLYNSLKKLHNNLQSYGSKLVLKKGVAKKILTELVEKTNSDAVYWNRCYDPYSIKKYTEIKKILTSSGIEVKSFNGSLLFEPWEIKNKSNNHFRVFTPFWKKCNLDHKPRALYKKPIIKNYDDVIESDNLDSWNLTPTKHDWTQKFSSSWKPGEENAEKLLSNFIENNIDEYKENRDIPGISGTSKLSPHLHFGEISPHQIWHKVKSYEEKKTYSNGASKFLSEIGWREFSYHQLYHKPDLASVEFNRKFINFPWEINSTDLAKWQKGETGYPIVDAGMRELWHTGWMHNRVRMITASFLTKHLLIPWQKGAEWFLYTLLDADIANNAMGWQWVAGCGADAAPYFRIFNPITQSVKFDPSGEYIRKWIPEIASLPKKYIHTPWNASNEILKSSNITLGRTYPKPIIDHLFARKRALEIYSTL